MAKEWRVFIKGFKGGQGHYILANTKKSAIAIDKKSSQYRKSEPLDAQLWKVGKHDFDLKLTSLAKKQMHLK